jgi:hypothetical protein
MRNKQNATSVVLDSQESPSIDVTMTPGQDSIRITSAKLASVTPAIGTLPVEELTKEQALQELSLIAARNRQLLRVVYGEEFVSIEEVETPAEGETPEAFQARIKASPDLSIPAKVRALFHAGLTEAETHKLLTVKSRYVLNTYRRECASLGLTYVPGAKMVDGSWTLPENAERERATPNRVIVIKERFEAIPEGKQFAIRDQVTGITFSRSATKESAEESVKAANDLAARPMKQLKDAIKAAKDNKQQKTLLTRMLRIRQAEGSEAVETVDLSALASQLAGDAKE